MGARHAFPPAPVPRRGRFGAGRPRGQAMVEFALVLPILVMTLLAIVEFGFLLREYLALNYLVSQAAEEASLLRGVSSGDVRVLRTMLRNAGGLDPTRMRIILGDGSSYGPVFLSGTDVTDEAGSVIESPPTSMFFYGDNGTPNDTTDDVATLAGDRAAALARISVSYLHRNLGPYPEFMGLREFTFLQSKTVRLE